MFEINAKSAAEALPECLWMLRTCGELENSRNGVAIVLPAPFMLTLYDPRNRVIRCPIRNANPFFHVMEVVWMFAGKHDTEWLKQFNKNVDNYANEGSIHGAYGFRWFELWGNQVHNVVKQLKYDRGTRQAVISMWDPVTDHDPTWRDRPCNTHLYFRYHHGRLDMTVCNRSNDIIWGMLGANVVHMTYLHELVAKLAGMELGWYQVFTNNLHFYTDVYPNGDAIWNELVEGPWSPSCRVPILQDGEDLDKFVRDCKRFISGDHQPDMCSWLKLVALPMYMAYLARTHQGRMSHALLIADEAWRLAATEWLERSHARKEHSHS